MKKLFVPGFSFSSVTADVRGKGEDRPDMGLIYCHGLSAAAGIFTTNSMAAPPVRLCRERLASGGVRAVLVNSGNANAMTGKEGYEDAVALCRSVAELLDVPAESVLFCSTGVIGERLPVHRMEEALPRLTGNLSDRGAGLFSEAILTTDTCTKIAGKQTEVSKGTAGLLGIAKGAGMIAPKMATMLAFIMTDANIEPDTMGTMLREVNQETFGAITIDGDTSTNDTVLFISSGAGPAVRDEQDIQAISTALKNVCLDLAEQIVSDGEGTTRVVQVQVGGAVDDDQAQSAARAVAESLLVKTAFAAADPNWGRIAAAVGYSGAETSSDALSLSIGDVQVLAGGRLVDGYNESLAAEQMSQKRYTISISLGNGPGSASILTTDLTEEYVRINCEYRS
jgi:glutamate N-acetyltransferase/amino-acid N-acetyltransferase